MLQEEKKYDKENFFLVFHHSICQVYKFEKAGSYVCWMVEHDKVLKS